MTATLETIRACRERRDHAASCFIGEAKAISGMVRKGTIGAVQAVSMLHQAVADLEEARVIADSGMSLIEAEVQDERVGA